mgnify:CR=1 FL=1
MTREQDDRSLAKEYSAPYKVIAQGKRAVVTTSNVHIANRVLFKVFSQLEFPTADMRHILHDSYKANIVDLILFAKENGLCPYAYIKGIKQELLKDPNVRER